MEGEAKSIINALGGADEASSELLDRAAATTDEASHTHSVRDVSCRFPCTVNSGQGAGKRRPRNSSATRIRSRPDWQYLFPRASRKRNIVQTLLDRNTYPAGLVGSAAIRSMINFWIERQSVEKFSCNYVELPRTTISAIAISFSADGRCFASTHGDHSVKIVDFPSGRVVQTLVGHPRTPWTVKYHPSNPRVLASGCLGHHVRIWDTETGRALYTTQLHHSIISLAFHPTGDLIAIASANKLYMWRFQMAQPVVVHTGERLLRCVRFSQSGAHIILGEANDASTGFSTLDSTVKLSLWSFDVDSFVNGGFSRGTSKVLENQRVVLPHATLYSDGGFDVSQCGRFLVACAVLGRDKNGDGGADIDSTSGAESVNVDQLGSDPSSGSGNGRALQSTGSLEMESDGSTSIAGAESGTTVSKTEREMENRALASDEGSGARDPAGKLATDQALLEPKEPGRGLEIMGTNSSWSDVAVGSAAGRQRSLTATLARADAAQSALSQSQTTSDRSDRATGGDVPIDSSLDAAGARGFAGLDSSRQSKARKSQHGESSASAGQVHTESACDTESEADSGSTMLRASHGAMGTELQGPPPPRAAQHFAVQSTGSRHNVRSEESPSTNAREGPERVTGRRRSRQTAEMQASADGSSRGATPRSTHTPPPPVPISRRAPAPVSGSHEGRGTDREADTRAQRASPAGAASLVRIPLDAATSLSRPTPSSLSVLTGDIPTTPPNIGTTRASASALRPPPVRRHPGSPPFPLPFPLSSSISDSTSASTTAPTSADSPTLSSTTLSSNALGGPPDGTARRVLQEPEMNDRPWEAFVQQALHAARRTGMEVFAQRLLRRRLSRAASGTDLGGGRRRPVNRQLLMLYSWSTHLTVVSLEPETLGNVITSTELLDAEAVTSVKFSPLSSFIMLGYGVRDLTDPSNFRTGSSGVTEHRVVSVYRASDLSMVNDVYSTDDDVNVALFHPLPGEGFVYAAKQGRLRIAKINGEKEE